MTGRFKGTFVRSITGIVFIAIMVGSMFLNPVAFGAVMTIAIIFIVNVF